MNAKALKTEIKRYETLATKVEAIKGDDDNNGILNKRIQDYRAKAAKLQMEYNALIGVDAAAVRDTIANLKADTYKGMVFELCKNFTGTYSASDLYPYAEELAAKYPNFERDGAYGDNIKNAIRDALSVLDNKDGLVARVGFDAYKTL